MTETREFKETIETIEIIETIETIEITRTRGIIETEEKDKEIGTIRKKIKEIINGKMTKIRDKESIKDKEDKEMIIMKNLLKDTEINNNIKGAIEEKVKRVKTEDNNGHTENTKGQDNKEKVKKKGKASKLVTIKKKDNRGFKIEAEDNKKQEEMEKWPLIVMRKAIFANKANA